MRERGAWALVLLLAAGPGGAADGPIDNFTPAAGDGFTPLGEAGRVDRHGSGPVPVILIPGLDFGGELFHSFVERNGDRYTLYAVTPAGAGGTPSYPMPSAADVSHTVWLDATRDAVLGLVRDEGLVGAVVVGHGVGGALALELALEHPEAVAGVVAVATPPMARFPSGEAPESLDERMQLLDGQWVPFFRRVDRETWNSPWASGERPLAQDPERSAEVRDAILARSVPVSVRYFAEYLTTDLRRRLAALAVPSLVVIPERPWPMALAGRARLRAEEFSGDVAAARAAVEAEFLERHGSEAAARAALVKNDAWEALRGRVPGQQLEYVDGVAWTLVWDDRPERFDALVSGFVGAVADR